MEDANDLIETIDSDEAKSKSSVENSHANDNNNDEPNGRKAPKNASNSLALLQGMDACVQLDRCDSILSNDKPELENDSIASTSSVSQRGSKTQSSSSSRLVRKKASHFQCKKCKYATNYETTSSNDTNSITFVPR